MRRAGMPKENRLDRDVERQGGVYVPALRSAHPANGGHLMKAETKLAVRRVAIRWARKLLDFLYESLDGRLHAEEVRLRDDIELARLPVRVPLEPACAPEPKRNAVPGPVPRYDEFLHDRVRGRASFGGEPQRPAQNKTRRVRCTSATFDLRFSNH